MTDHPETYEIRIVPVKVPAKGIEIKTAIDLKDVVKKISKAHEEQTLVVSIDAQYCLINSRIISIGSESDGVTELRAIFRGAVRDNAKCIIHVHTHPSGNCFPSAVDERFYRNLEKACDVLDIRLLDCLIVCPNGSMFSRAGDTRVL